MEIFSALVGTNFRPSEARERAKQLALGDTLILEAEPSNPYDSNAVKVIINDIDPEDESHDIFIGYLSRESNAETAAHLAEEGAYECEVVGFLATNKPHLKITLLGDDEGDDD